MTVLIFNQFTAASSGNQLSPKFHPNDSFLAGSFSECTVRPTFSILKCEKRMAIRYESPDSIESRLTPLIHFPLSYHRIRKMNPTISRLVWVPDRWLPLQDVKWILVCFTNKFHVRWLFIYFYFLFVITIGPNWLQLTLTRKVTFVIIGVYNDTLKKVSIWVW